MRDRGVMGRPLVKWISVGERGGRLGIEGVRQEYLNMENWKHFSHCLRYRCTDIFIYLFICSSQT